MRTHSLLLAVTLGLAAVSSASAEAFTAKYSWAGIAACEKISPAFELAAVPPGTKQLRFNMTDVNVPAFHHGGSAIAHDGGAVKQGAIRYVGPCPPPGEHHRYRWTIEAVDAGGKVLGVATAVQSFPP
jgi:phosphatidylethanolamine-binding protein (PEBP) family uncharacterized protein